jgi:hypothetical protein
MTVISTAYIRGNRSLPVAASPPFFRFSSKACLENPIQPTIFAYPGFLVQVERFA